MKEARRGCTFVEQDHIMDMRPKNFLPTVILIGNYSKVITDLLERFPDLDYEVWSNDEEQSKKKNANLKSIEKAEILALIEQDTQFYLVDAKDWEFIDQLTAKFPTSDGLITLHLSDIIFCKKIASGTRITLRGGEIKTMLTFTEVEEQLQLLPLQRIQADETLNLRYVAYCPNKNEVQLINDKILEVTIPYQDELANQLLRR